MFTRLHHRGFGNNPAIDSPVLATNHRIKTNNQASNPLMPAAALLCLVAIAQVQKGADAPKVSFIGMAAPGVIELAFTPPRFVPTSPIAYVPAPGDEVKTEVDSEGQTRRKVLIRAGKRIGWIVGKSNTTLVPFPLETGTPLGPEAGVASNYQVVVKVAGNTETYFVEQVQSVAADQCPKGEPTVYLVLNKPIPKNSRVEVDLSRISVQDRSAVLVFDPNFAVTRTFMVNPLGFRVDDPIKTAHMRIPPTFKSNTFPRLDKFTIRRAGTQEPVYTWEPEKNDLTNYPRINFMVTKPGKYQLFMDSIGCSAPFEVGDVYGPAFRAAMTGFVNVRSGLMIDDLLCALPHPRDLHPDSGATVLISNAKISDPPAQIIKQATSDKLPGGWGGYKEAYAWQRDTSSLHANYLMLELFELFPDTFKSLRLDVPERTSPLPDLLDEAAWNLDFFRRLQTVAGGIRGGITAARPGIPGERSWENSLPLYACAPDATSSFRYAALAAKLARSLSAYDGAKSATFTESAKRAAAWAEDQRSQMGEKEKADKELNRVRFMANMELYLLTKEPAFFTPVNAGLFLMAAGDQPIAGPLGDYRSPIFTYCVAMPNAPLTPDLIKQFLKLHKSERDFQTPGPFGETLEDFKGTFNTAALGLSNNVGQLRCFYLSKDTGYLSTAIRGIQAAMGANLTARPITSGLVPNLRDSQWTADSLFSGSSKMVGITSSGPNWQSEPVYAGLRKRFGDSGAEDPQFEYSVGRSMGPAAYIYGFLMARPKTAPLGSGDFVNRAPKNNHQPLRD